MQIGKVRFCNKCRKIVKGGSVEIGEEIYHAECYLKSRKAQKKPLSQIKVKTGSETDDAK